jgi:hypothetical protein
VIEIKYDSFSTELYWTPLRDSAETLIADQSTSGSFSSEGGAGSKTAYVAERAYICEMTDTHGGGAGLLPVRYRKIHEPVAISSSGEFQIELDLG